MTHSCYCLDSFHLFKITVKNQN